MPQSLPLRRWVEEHLASGGTALRVDLQQCTYMDSTFIGTLLCLKRAADAASASFALLSPSEPCTRLLEQMGLQDLLTTEAAAASDAEDWVTLPVEEDDLPALRGTMFAAHKELSQVQGPGCAPFRDMVRCLEREMGAEKAAKRK
jgi:anti-anti-sigma factor